MVRLVPLVVNTSFINLSSEVRPDETHSYCPLSYL